MSLISHLVQIQCKVDDLKALEATLNEMGYGSIRNTEMKSSWWASKKVDLLLTKDGRAKTIGWQKNAEGSYDIVADWYSTGINQKQFVEEVNIGHAKHKASDWLISNGYSVAYEVAEDGDLVVVGSKW